MTVVGRAAPPPEAVTEPYRSIQLRLYRSDSARLKAEDTFIRPYEAGEFWPSTDEELPGLDSVLEIEVGWMAFKAERLRTRRPHPDAEWVVHDAEAAACWQESERASE